MQSQRHKNDKQQYYIDGNGKPVLANVELEFVFDKNGKPNLIVVPKTPKYLVFKGAGARGLGYVGALLVLQAIYLKEDPAVVEDLVKFIEKNAEKENKDELIKFIKEKMKNKKKLIPFIEKNLKRPSQAEAKETILGVGGSSAGACSALYFAVINDITKFLKISKDKDLSIIQEVKHHNAPPEKQPALTELPPHQLPKSELSIPKKIIKATYKVAKGVKNVLGKKRGIFSGKKIAEEINHDLAQHVKEVLQKILDNIKDHQEKEALIHFLKEKGPLKDYQNNKVTLKTFEDVLLKEKLFNLKINNTDGKEKIIKSIQEIGSLRNKKNRNIILNKAKKIFGIDSKDFETIKHYLEEFQDFEYMMEMEVLTFGHFHEILQRFPAYFRCDPYIHVSNIGKKSKQQEPKPEIFSHRNAYYLPMGIACQMSMSIPVVFKRVRYNGCYYEDGGVQSNCPDDMFDSPEFHPLKGRDNQNLMTLLLRMDNDNEMKFPWKQPTPPPEPKSIKEKLVRKMMKAFLSADFVQTSYQNADALHKKFGQRRIQISDKVKEVIVKSTQFALTEDLKNGLLLNGIDSALRFIMEYAESALCFIPFNSFDDMKKRNKVIVEVLNSIGAYLPQELELLKVLEKKLSDPSISSEKLFPGRTPEEAAQLRKAKLIELKKALYSDAKKTEDFLVDKSKAYHPVTKQVMVPNQVRARGLASCAVPKVYSSRVSPNFFVKRSDDIACLKPLKKRAVGFR